ncbi:pilus assembly FimT family protein [Stieleria neptunia]|uniref:pilus assembly FimT family protein n=1 Tax=Stieleria neptunia TaxID=2527979 RepID=UPI0018D25D5C|nr:type II secretion system protein [Stieleria neptunia]
MNGPVKPASLTQSNTRSRVGFTLVEILTVVVIVSLLAGVALVSVSVPLRRSQADAAIAEFRSLDLTARLRSSAGLGGWIAINSAEKEIVYSESDVRQGQRRVQLPAGTLIQRVRGLSRNGSRSYVVRYSNQGTSQTYAVEIAAKGNRARWLLFLGLTGQSYVLDDSKLIDEIFRGPSPAENAGERVARRDAGATI